MDPTLGVLTLGATQWVIGALSVLFLLSSVVLILTVLIQRPQGGGLSGAFGGGGGSGETAFGARTGDALTIATIAFFVIWLVVAVGLVLSMQPEDGPPGPAAVSTNPAEATGSSGAGQPADTGVAPTEDGADPLDEAGTPDDGSAGDGAADESVDGGAEGGDESQGDDPAGDTDGDGSSPPDTEQAGEDDGSGGR